MFVIWWSLGTVCTVVLTSQSQDGGCGEDRTAVPNVVKMESELCVYTRVSTLHTHTHI